MSEVRHCKGYLVQCKNSAVTGRLFCFTCAGRKSRLKKTSALETSQMEVMKLREELDEVLPRLEHWRKLATKLEQLDSATQKELSSLRQQLKMQGDQAKLPDLNIQTMESSVFQLDKRSQTPSPPLEHNQLITITDNKVNAINHHEDEDVAATVLLNLSTPQKRKSEESHPAARAVPWKMAELLLCAPVFAPAAEGAQ